MAGLGTDELSNGNKDYVQIQEGKAKILFPSQNEVFYNPVQEFNRDLSTLTLRHYSKTLWSPHRGKKKKGPSKKTALASAPSQPMECEDSSKLKDVDQHDQDSERIPTVDTLSPDEGSNTAEDQQGNSRLDVPGRGLKILEALSATGLRSIRYALEIPGVEEVTANDYSPSAFQSMKRNIEFNKVDHLVKPHCQDASLLMYTHRDAPSRYDVVDVDPYGAPTDFLDAAIQAVDDGGLLCVTCTDMAVLCGNHPEVCHAKYNSVSLKGGFCHEMALRILLSSLESHANRYQRYIVPLVSCSIDFYVRVFVQVFTSPAEVKRSMSKLAMMYVCTGCGNYHLQPLGKKTIAGAKSNYPSSTGPPVGLECDNCHYKFRFGGPIWQDPIHNQEFVEGLLAEVQACKKDFGTGERITGILSLIKEELHDVPLFHVVDEVCSTLHCTSPNMLSLRSAILHSGYRVSISHTNARAIKTDAPHDVLWDIFRCWVKAHGIKKQSASSPSSRILSVEPKIEACFDIHPNANPPSRLLKLKRFPDNPQAYWGPKAKAGRDEDLVQKKTNQGRRRGKKPSQLVKKFPCRRFAEGACTLGEECKFIHVQPQVSSADDTT